MQFCVISIFNRKKQMERKINREFFRWKGPDKYFVKSFHFNPEVNSVSTTLSILSFYPPLHSLSLSPPPPPPHPLTPFTDADQNQIHYFRTFFSQTDTF